ncbi:MAG: excalibur calcium-binding domain-containing protein [Jatrophihabitantaceae bacterium]
MSSVRARRRTGLVVATATACALLTPASDASAVVVRHIANCTAMHHRYPHGVGRLHARDHTSGTPVTTFFRNNRLYAANSGSDRDNDGIACEKR